MDGATVGATPWQCRQVEEVREIQESDGGAKTYHGQHGEKRSGREILAAGAKTGLPPGGIQQAKRGYNTCNEKQERRNSTLGGTSRWAKDRAFRSGALSDRSVARRGGLAIADREPLRMVGAGRFERPTPCAQGTRVISNGSVVFRRLLKFTTIRGICFRSKSNSNDWNAFSPDTVVAQLRSSGATTA